MSEKAYYNIIAAVIAGCALVSTFVFARREATASRREAPIIVEEWRAFDSSGNVLGASEAPRRTIVVFGDYQCPFCRRFALVIDSLVARHADIRVVERHFPLVDIHPQAYGAALAAECGAEAGAYQAVRRALYERRVAVEERAWGSIASASGISDTAAFADCVHSERHAGRVREDTEAAGRLRISGTPAVLVGRQLFAGALSLGELEQVLGSR